MTLYDDIANDMAIWIDQTATEVALGFAPARAPFSAKITEQQKVDYYTRQLFNPDGSVNAQGRQNQIQRLGAEGFAKVYQAVVGAHPELKPPEQGDSIDQLAPMPPQGPPPMPLGVPGRMPIIPPGGVPGPITPNGPPPMAPPPRLPQGPLTPGG